MPFHTSPTPHAPIAPSCKWTANSHRLTWILLRQLQQNPSIRAALWPITGDPPTTHAKRNASEELARKTFADEPFYQQHVDADPSYYGKATKGKIWMLRKRYERLQKKLKTTSEGVALGGESEVEMKLLCESIKKEYPYYPLLMAINGDPETIFTSEPRLGLKPGLVSPGSSGTLEACSTGNLGVAAPKDVPAEFAAKEIPGNAEKPMDEVARDKKEVCEEEDDYSSTDFDPDGIHIDEDDIDEDTGGGEGDQEGTQNKVQGKMHTDGELVSEVPVYLENFPRVSHTPPAATASSPTLPLDGDCNALKEPSSSPSNKRTRDQNDDSRNDVGKSLDEYLTQLNGLRYKAACELHREKMRRKQDRFNMKAQERQAEREHERYMIDAKIKLAQVKYRPLRSCTEEGK